MSTGNEALNNLFKELESKFWDDLKKDEGIEKWQVDLVDLNIEFSPVIPFKGSRPVEPIPTIGGDYIVPGFPAPSVSPEMLKVMRYRYLSNRKGIAFY